MNRINQTLKNNQGLLTLYFTAGYPRLEDTFPIITSAQNSGVKMIEIGIPFSDPLADGPVIQASGIQALKNGMNLKTLFDQLKDLRKTIHIPVILMGYFNSIYVYGVEKFVKKCAEIGIDGIIFPDLPIEVYIEDYEQLFKENNISNILLITPQTPKERIKIIDDHSSGFIYVVSTSSTTGNSYKKLQNQQEYFDSINSMKLKNPIQIGFGISNKEDYLYVCKNAQGAIVGSDFISHLSSHGASEESITSYVSKWF